MRLRFNLALAAVALLMSNCSQEETLNQAKGGTNTLTATVENTSRSAVTDKGVFSWTAGDKISVYNGAGFTEFTYSGNGNSFTGETITPSGVAVYPAGEHKYDGTNTTINLPSSYNYGSTNAPMVAEINSSSLTFKHVGGLMRFVVEGMPSEANKFTFTANSGITGDFEVNEGTIVANESGNKTVTINFTEEQYNAESMTFYIPLPTGSYAGYTVSVGDGENMSHVTGSEIINKIDRATLLLMPTFTYNETEGLQKNSNKSVAVEAGEQTLAVNGNQNLEIEVPTSMEEGVEAILNLNYTPSTDNASLNLSDGSEEGATPLAESKAKVVITPTTEALIETLNITTPSLTVELGAGKYGTVTALTASQTLIIGEDVEIEKLVLKGGNVKLNGDLVLKNPLEVNQDLILDLNGYTLSTAEENGDNWSAAVIVYSGNVTIKGGTIATNGTEAHKLMGAVWVRGTESANVTIENGTFKGNCWKVTPASAYTDNLMATVYVSNTQGKVTINGGEFYAVNQAQEPGQNQILNYSNSLQQGTIAVKGGKFHGMNPAVGNGVEVSYLADDAVVVETSAGVFEVLPVVDGTLTLAENMTIVSPMVLKSDVILDLNGKTLSTAEANGDNWSAAVIVYSGDVTIKGGTIATKGTEAHKLMGAVWVRGTESANVTIESGTFKGNCWNVTPASAYTDDLMATVYVSNTQGKVTINGGEFYAVNQAQEPGQNQILNYSNSLQQGTIAVKGGKFHGMNPAVGNGVEVSYLADDAVVVETSAGVFEVLPVVDGTLTLAENMTIVSPMVLKSDVILDLNGKTLSTAEANGDNWSAAVIVYSGDVTIKGGTIATNGTEAHKLMGAVWVRGTESANVTIKDGTFKGNCWDVTPASAYTDDLMATVYVSNTQGKVTINGGEFYAVNQAQEPGQNQILNYSNSLQQGTIAVKGGKFHGMNPAVGNGVEVSYLAEGYKSVESQEGDVKVYTVSLNE